MNSFEKPACVEFFGAPGSGKSHTIRFLAYNLVKLRKIQRINVFTGNIHNQEYTKWVDKNSVHGDPEEWTEKITEFVADIKKLPPNQKDLTLWIFDDWTGKLDWTKGIYQQLATDFRQLNLILFIVCHFPHKIPPITREAATDYCMYKQQGRPGIEALYAACGESYFEGKEAWRKWLSSSCDFDKKIFVWYSKNPEAGNSVFQPVQCPAVIPEFFVRNNIPQKRKREEPEDDEPDSRPNKKGRR